VTVSVPASLDAALVALREDPEAHVLAGGTDFMVEVNFGHRRPPTVLAVQRVAELQGLVHDEAAGTVRIGAGVTWSRLLEPPVATLVPALAQAARTVGSPQIRNAGTLGGNLGTCSPAGDGLPVLSALDAVVELASVEGTRSLDVHEFMVGVKRTARRPDELITAVTVPVLDGFQGYAKVGVRNAMVISAAGACLVVDRAGRTVRLALGAVGPTILRARAAEAWVAGVVDWEAGRLAGGADGAADVAEEFGRRAAAEARPIDDHRASAAYRRHAIGVLATRLLRRAFPT
jgi:CO/xanthine dehydrogenase FAD-binding subunit